MSGVPTMLMTEGCNSYERESRVWRDQAQNQGCLAGLTGLIDRRQTDSAGSGLTVGQWTKRKEKNNGKHESCTCKYKQETKIGSV